MSAGSGSTAATATPADGCARRRPTGSGTTREGRARPGSRIRGTPLETVRQKWDLTEHLARNTFACTANESILFFTMDQTLTNSPFATREVQPFPELVCLLGVKAVPTGAQSSEDCSMYRGADQVGQCFAAVFPAGAEEVEVPCRPGADAEVAIVPKDGRAGFVGGMQHGGGHRAQAGNGKII